MGHNRILGAAALAFTIAAVCLMLFHGNAAECAAMTTVALLAQLLYGKALKRTEKNLPESNRTGKRHSNHDSSDIWNKRYYGKR